MIIPDWNPYWERHTVVDWYKLSSWLWDDKFHILLPSHSHPRWRNIFSKAFNIECLTKIRKLNVTEKLRHERGSQEMKYMNVNKDRKMLVLIFLLTRRFCVCMFVLWVLSRSLIEFVILQWILKEIYYRLRLQFSFKMIEIRIDKKILKSDINDFFKPSTCCMQQRLQWMVECIEQKHWLQYRHAEWPWIPSSRIWNQV